MDALEVEMRIAEGEQALQALLKFAREQAGTLDAHAAEQASSSGCCPWGWRRCSGTLPSAGRVLWDRPSRGPTA